MGAKTQFYAVGRVDRPTAIGISAAEKHAWGGFANVCVIAQRLDRWSQGTNQRECH